MALGSAAAQEEETGDGKNPSGGGGPVPNRVQGAANQTFSGTSVAVTLGSNVTAGNALLVYACGSASGVVDPPSGVTANAVSMTAMGTSATNTGGYTCTGFYLANAAAGATTFTATYSVACVGCNILAEEFSGVLTSSPLDGQNAAWSNNGGGTAGTGSFTTTVAGDLIWTVNFVPNSVAPTIPSGYTAGISNADSFWSAWLVQGSAGATNPTWTLGATAFNNYLIGAGLKP